ncbi:hypothetical protein [Streptomyces sp. AC558_RSS880]|uniref:hypothetical protein n=1 Tax=Streptomyces sp. AC558_RSS880 TaxID=2823687 RepID=UPI001C21564E|nr:hypothetical protein [Streptomyces sp. AC558_RSS880]
MTTPVGYARHPAPGFREALAFERTKFTGLRSTLWTTAATALVTVAGAVFVGLSGPLLGDLQRRLTGATPTAAPEKLTQTSDATPDTVGTLGPWPFPTLVTVYTALALTGAGPAPGGRTVRAPVPPPPPRRARCFRGRTAG